MAKKNINILFVCTGNTCRSVMAQGLFQKICSGLEKEIEIKISSAGLGGVVGLHAAPEALEVLREEGVDLSGHRSRAVDQKKIAEAHYIFTMTHNHKQILLHNFPEAADKIWLLRGFLPGMDGKDVADPYGSSLDYYRAIAAEIKGALREIRPKLTGDEQ